MIVVQYWLPLANVISAFVLLGSYVVALIAITASAEGRARTLGVLGVIILFLSTVLDGLNGSLAPLLAQSIGTKIDVYGLGSIAAAGVGAIGLVLLAFAVAAGHKPARPVRHR